MDIQRSRVIFDGRTCEEDCTTGESKSITRSIILNQGKQQVDLDKQQVHLKSRLLRVLVGGESSHFINQQVNLRFINYVIRKQFVSCSYYIPSSISLIWNLQTLIFKSRYGRLSFFGLGHLPICAPSEIWKMPQLRHLMCDSISLPEPSPVDGIVLHNLQTLGIVDGLEFSEEACKKMPNIKKLGVSFVEYSERISNFVLLNKLESLHCEFTVSSREGNSFLKFPNSLKKLTIDNLPLEWEDLRVISLLPRLEALILENSITADNWDLADLEFHRLRFLKVIGSDLKCWNANDTHFPVLEDLTLSRMKYLYEIPSEIGDIQTLQCISLYSCSVSACISAVQIQKEQEDFGNKGLQVNIYLNSKGDIRRFMESVELEGLTGVNFQITEV